MRHLILLLFTLSLISCGPLNTINSNNSDGIYGNNVNVESSSNNGTFYKNYFDQKSNELGLNPSLNDSIITDVNSYSSNTNVSYNNSNGSWGDSPTSINIIFRDRTIYTPYMNYNPYGYNRYGNYFSSYWNWYSPWGLNYHRYGYGYGYVLDTVMVTCGIIGGTHIIMDHIIMIRIILEMDILELHI